MEIVKLLIVDNNEIFRRGLTKLLNELSHLQVAENCEFGEHLMNVILKHSPDIVIMDTPISEVKIPEMIRKIKSLSPTTKLVSLARKTTYESVINIVQAGASSYLAKNTSLGELINALEKVQAGERYFPPRVSSIIFQHMAEPINTSMPSGSSNTCLTKRELEILTHISSELTNKEIAEKLFISRRTVDTHRRNLLLKLGVKNTAGLMKYYFNNIRQDGSQIQY